MSSRALISFGDERIAKLDRLARERGRSRSALVREAVDQLMARDTPGDDARLRRDAELNAACGLWKHHGFTEDGVAYQRRLRAEWVREWDPDYEAVKAEFPDVFRDRDV